MRLKPFLFAVFAFAIIACQKSKENLQGLWRATVPTEIGEIPFHLLFEQNGDSIQVFAVNAKEKLALDHAYWQNDSLHISMEVFDAKIVAAVKDGEMNGTYTKKLGNLNERSGVFYAKKGIAERFLNTQKTSHTVSGKWATTFADFEGNSYPAIGLFEQTHNDVFGTFLTSTGDYRYLQGNVVGDSLLLSCFDGTHIFLFKALIKGDSLVNGQFSSSLKLVETFSAHKDENASLPDATKLTYLKPGFTSINFSFPNTKGKMISPEDEEYKGKVRLIQILGSWCPNCMDESRFLGQWLKENPDKDLKVIGLAFEKKTDPDFAFPKINRMKERFGMPYEVLLAGLNSGEDAQKALPMLNHVMSFPTTIFIDKKGTVRKIHTGFAGPGTGKYYEDFVKEFDVFVNELLAE